MNHVFDVLALAFGVLILSVVVIGFRKGRVDGRGYTIAYARQPIVFWFFQTWYGACGVAAVAYGIWQTRQ